VVYFSNRMFVSTDGTRYEWRRYPGDPTAYDVVVFSRVPAVALADDLFKLYLLPHTPIAKFRREYEDTPGELSRDSRVFNFHLINSGLLVGPSYAYLQFCFDDDQLLLEALLALSLNRWMDM
jgi:hypothetical protein